MGTKILTLILIHAALSSSALAVGYYTPPCEEEKRKQDESFESIQKCFEMRMKENEGSDLSQACLAEFQLAAKHYRSSKLCERKAGSWGSSKSGDKK